MTIRFRFPMKDGKVDMNVPPEKIEATFAEDGPVVVYSRNVDDLEHKLELLTERVVHLERLVIATSGKIRVHRRPVRREYER